MEHTRAPGESAVAADRPGPWFGALACALRTGVVWVDRDGEPCFANTAARELLSLRAGTDEESDLEELRRILPGAIRRPRTKEPEVVTIDVAAPDESRTVSLRALPVGADDEHRGRLVLVEAAARPGAPPLLRSQVHDLRTPLNALTLNLELMRKGIEDGAERAEQLASIEALQRDIHRLGKLLETYADASPEPAFATPASTAPARTARRFDLRRAVRDVASRARPSAAAAGIRVETRLAPEPVHLVASSAGVKQALLAVVSCVRADCGAGDALRIAVAREGAEARVVVSDARAAAARRAPASARELVARANGAGLATARSLVEDQGGRLELARGAGPGTEFHCVFPAR